MIHIAVEEFKKAVTAGADNTDVLYGEAAKAVNITATKSLIHKSKANRDKTRLGKLAKQYGVEASTHVNFFFHQKMSKSVFTETRTLFYRGGLIHGKSVVKC